LLGYLLPSVPVVCEAEVRMKARLGRGTVGRYLISGLVGSLEQRLSRVWALMRSIRAERRVH
jgi:hypothetical protein